MGTRESIFHNFAEHHVRREGDPVVSKDPRPMYIAGHWMKEITSIDSHLADIAKHAMLDLLADSAVLLSADPHNVRAFALSARINALLRQVTP